MLKDEMEISLLDEFSKKFHKELIIVAAYLAKGLEFDAVIAYNNRENSYKKNERNPLYAYN